MSDRHHLHGGLATTAARRPDAEAVHCGSVSTSYGELVGAANRLAAQLMVLGLEPGDRVGLLLPKSVDSIIAMLGVLTAGGVYVPVDEQSPAPRQQALLEDCGVRGIIGTRDTIARLVELDASFVSGLGFLLGRDCRQLPGRWHDWEPSAQPRAPASLPEVAPDQAAYILYTSGSTGRPKGVTVSHRGARAFVDWAVRTFRIDASDRLANHAQLSFDLSVLDVFGALAAGASVHLLTPADWVRPDYMVDLLLNRQITLWYSVPSALSLLETEGGLSRRPLPSLRRVLFAGEVFPVPRLRSLMRAQPEAQYFNLFGPTETNVCTWHALRTVPSETTNSIPIGRPCDHLRTQVRTATGSPVRDGGEGELCVAGPSVMLGYFGNDAVTEAAFWTDADTGRWYRTGDRVRADQDGTYWFLGRRDRQVKRRGYRIELGEVEAALAQMPGVRDAVAVATDDQTQGTRITAWVAPEPGAALDTLTVKLHCGRLLPRYMVPDTVQVRPELPRTATGKLDRKHLT